MFIITRHNDNRHQGTPPVTPGVGLAPVEILSFDGAHVVYIGTDDIQ
jgi:hypothetical protein